MIKAIQVTLFMLLGSMLGAIAVQSLNAQARPAAFNIAEITVTNSEGYSKEYLPLILKSIEDAGGRFIVRGGKTIPVVGPEPAPRIAVIQFNSLDKAQAWIKSPNYTAAQAVGDRYAIFRGYQVEGIAP